MTVQELIQRDKTFNSEMFLSKAKNMIERVFAAVSENKLEKVDHFISDKVYDKFMTQINYADSKGCKLVFDKVRLNITITDIGIEVDSYRITTNVKVSCLRLFKSKENDSIVGGNINSFTHTDHVVVFKKKINNEVRVTNRCRGCGNTFDITQSGICPVCGRVFELEEVDYYIDDFR